MTPIQQLMIGIGASEQTYADEVFSTNLYRGNGANNRAITGTGVNLSENGGLLWIKSRTDSENNQLVDSAQGVNKVLQSNSTGSSVTQTNRVSAFGTDGFTLGATADWGTNRSGAYYYSAWSFRKSPGFFDCKTFTWNGSSGGYTTLAVNHDLKSVPGMVMIKGTNGQDNWKVYHRDLGTGDNKMLALNTTDAAHGMNTSPNNNHFVSVTDTAVTFKSLTNTRSYVMYVFAGGESTASEARSVEFDGVDDSLLIESNSDLAFGTGDFTIEFWVKPQTLGYMLLFDMRPNPAATQGVYPVIYYENNRLGYFTDSADRIIGDKLSKDQWQHIALSRSGTSTKMFQNGTQVGSTYSDSNNYLNGDTTIGLRSDGSSGDFDGYISNVRCVKGTAVYTSSFRPPTKPLANITNTKLLCCNNSSTSGSTVTPSTITANGTTASSDSPFDDPAGFVFGNKKEGIIKCGSYVGNGSSTGPEINLGWEPSWLLIKRSSGSEDWMLFDNMRTSTRTDMYLDDLKPNSNSSEGDGAGGDSNSFLNLTSTGFKLQSNTAHTNDADDTYIYMAIRRSDGYVGKPIEVGTHAFTLVTGNNGYPSFTTNVGSYAGFPVDFALMRQPATSQACYTGARLVGPHYLQTTSDAVENNSADVNWVFDRNNGWCRNYASSYQSWMWKRHAGMDVVTYEGNGVAGRGVPHSMNKIPEMIWVKKRKSGTGGSNWLVYHKGLNGGTNPEQYYILLNGSSADVDDATIWNDVAPTKTHFTLGTNSNVNQSGDKYIAMLFSSVPGVSSVGYFDGSDSSHTIVTGFQPRWALFKNTTGFAQWVMADTIRGWTNGSVDWGLYLSHPNAHSDSNIGHPVSNGLYLDGDNGEISKAGQKHIYYTHA